MKLKSKQITDDGYAYRWEMYPIKSCSLEDALTNISKRLEKIEKIIEVDKYEIVKEEKVVRIKDETRKT